MKVIRGYGYYSTTKAQIKSKFNVKPSIWFYLTKSLWSFEIVGGFFLWSYVLNGFRIPFTLLAAVIDILRFTAYYTIIALYKIFVFLMTWIFDLLKQLIISAFNTFWGKFIGVLLIASALITIYIFLFETELYNEFKIIIQSFTHENNN